MLEGEISPSNLRVCAKMTFPFPYPGPVPPFTNVPENPQFYQPSQFFIQSITNGIETLVTTTVDHNFVVGQLVRLLIPQVTQTIGIAPGRVTTITIPSSYELNEQTGNVVSIPNPNQVLLDLNSQFSTPFVTSSNPNQPQIVAIGDVNTGPIVSTGRINANAFIQGSFINISPL